MITASYMLIALLLIPLIAFIVIIAMFVRYLNAKTKYYNSKTKNNFENGRQD